MKTASAALYLSLAAAVAAYPNMGAYLAERDANDALNARATTPFPKASLLIGGIPRVPGSVPFDPVAQLVSVSGDHAWIAPKSTDQRGPCAGLNAAANHGYLPRDGIATFEAVQTGLWQAFGLDQTATQVLQQTTTFFVGDPISQRWSIGGFSPKTAALGGLQSLLGQESGIGQYGHLKSEGDASITRGDFTAPTQNSNSDSYPEFFQQLLDVGKKNSNGNITMADLAEHQNNRKLYSIATNPTYFSPAFAGVAFTPAAHHFVYALMANNSAEFPEGLLTPSTLMSFFSYKYAADGKTLIWTRGHERIPKNWYKRAVSNPWTMPDILVGVGQQCLAYPNTCAIGGNTGTVNSFAGIQVGDLSGGAFNAGVYTDPAQLGCFLSQNIQAEAPSFLSNVFQGPLLQTVLELVTSSLVPSLAQAFGACNGINVKGGNGAKGLSMSEFSSQFPDYKIVSSGPRAVSPAP